MNDAFNPYEARRSAADGPISDAEGIAGTPHEASGMPTQRVSEAARRAGRRTSPAGQRAWKYALVTLTAALLPACVAMIASNGPTEAPSKDGTRATASAAGASRLDARQNEAQRHHANQDDEQQGAPEESDFELGGADAKEPRGPVDDVDGSDANDDAADKLFDEPETSRQAVDGATSRQAAPSVDVGVGAETARGSGATDIEEHGSAIESSSPVPPELALADDPKDDGRDAPAGELAVAASSPANDWLKLDEHGEPCEVRLADGTTLKLDTYGGSFQGFDAQPPMLGDEADRVFTKIVGSFDPGWGSVALDLKHRTVYFVEGTEASSRLMRASLSGGNPRPLMKYSELQPDYPTPDPEHGKLYWYTRGLRNGSGRSIYRGNLDASKPKEIITGLTNTFHGFAIDSVDEKLYYFSSGRLIRTELDGSDEHALLKARGGRVAIDHDGGKIYWINGVSHLRRANLDGSGSEDVVEVLGRNIHGMGLDTVGKQLYWVMNQDVRRANLDGSNAREVLAGTVGHTDRLAIDAKKSHLYWMAVNVVHRKKEIGLWRADLAKPAKSKSKSAPALVTGLGPPKQSAGGKVSLQGANFTGTTEVLFVDDGTGEATKAKYDAPSDSTLAVVVPKLSDRCRHPVIIVQNEGGVTATLPRSARVVQHEAIDRFHADDQFAYVIRAGGAISVDRGMVLALDGSIATARQYGKSTFLLKNGSACALRGLADNLVYLEPSATLPKLDKPPKGTKLVRVPAIRPSFLEQLFEYQQPE